MIGGLCLCGCGTSTLLAPWRGTDNPSEPLRYARGHAPNTKRSVPERERRALEKLKHTWIRMHHRCANPRSPLYRRYGGRGISVCARWADFEAFSADMGPRPSSGHSIDRIDNNGNYEPSNVRWATHAEQTANKTFGRPKSPL